MYVRYGVPPATVKTEPRPTPNIASQMSGCPPLPMTLDLDLMYRFTSRSQSAYIVSIVVAIISAP